MKVISDNDSFIVVDKPPGQIVIPGRGANEGLPLVEEVEKLISSRIWVVHRLDKDTSGLVLFAKSAAAHKQLSSLFELREIKKTYAAVALGPMSGEGSIPLSIREFGSGRMGVDKRKGKRSRTLYSVTRSNDSASLLEVRPETGRRHQIRVHLYAIGHPILGDMLYGEPRPVGGCPRLMLHAKSLEFEYPRGITHSFTSEVPPDFMEITRQIFGEDS